MRVLSAAGLKDLGGDMVIIATSASAHEELKGLRAKAQATVSGDDANGLTIDDLSYAVARLILISTA